MNSRPMITHFQVIETFDIRAMANTIDSMMDVLYSLDQGDIPNASDYTRNHLRDYVASLVKGQRRSLGRTNPGSWSVAPSDEGMDSDVRVEFIFRPTYIATATLSRVLCDFPMISLSIPRYLKALTTGMAFCAYRGLQGHGYEADEGAIDALQILSIGKVPWLLNRHPEASPELKAAIDTVADDMAHRLLAGDAVGAWGEDYSEGFRSALETLRLTNDAEFMASIKLARRDPSKISRGDLPW